VVDKSQKGFSPFTIDVATISHLPLARMRLSLQRGDTGPYRSATTSGALLRSILT
jgi:hypothetical protein